MLSTNKLGKWIKLCEAAGIIFSTCSRKQYFAVVLSSKGRVLGTGFNGVASGLVHCVDGGCPRATSTVAHGSPYTGAGECSAVHAEANALLHSDRSAREGGTLVINGTPCWECSKLIAGSGISTVAHTEDPSYADWPKCRKLLHSAGVRVIAVATDSECGDTPSTVGVGQEVEVDLASGPSHGSSVVDIDRQWAALGSTPPFSCDGWRSRVQSDYLKKGNQ